MIKIAITGPESSGKTTLSEQLAEYFGVEWVPEFAREFLLKRGGVYQKKDLDTIAKGQFDAMRNIANSDLVFYDTDLFVIKIWSEHKYNSLSPVIQSLLDKQEVDLYLLCKPDLPWDEDPLRENPNDRDVLYDLYLDALKEEDVTFSIVSGLSDERIAHAIATVETFVKKKPLE